MHTVDPLAGMHADFRYAMLFSPKTSRDRLIALCNLYREIREILLECSDTEVAETKLRWWEQEIELMLEGKARHPVSQTFYRLCEKAHLTPKFFQDMIDSTRQDLYPPGFSTYSDVTRYCNRRGGALTSIAARLCGAEAMVSLAAARALGCGWQLANIVTRCAEDARQGRVYFASEDLQQHHLDRHVVEGRHTDSGLKALLADYTRRAEQLIQNALEATPEIERGELVSCSVLAALALARTRKLARRNFTTGNKAIELAPFSALLTAWSAARRANRQIVLQ